MKRAGRQLGAIALLAMLVRAIVPSGYMLAEADTPDGRYLVVQMCDAHNAAAQLVDLDTGKVIDASTLPKQTGGKSSSSPCVFAMSAQLASPPEGVTTIDFRPVFVADFPATLLVAPGQGIAAPPPPSTGPPSLI